ncbi:uncharacterized protein LOC135693325 isoform X2 [Rhopilema esculentum]|uniref:uncharacterized protein LOC135693325 isoform X2 n=1 Tax=Rhopilema esculentum TaxID=499914 RepID=UPI0031D75F09
MDQPMLEGVSLVSHIHNCGNGKVILAKFHSFLQHVVNEHENEDNQVFNKCARDKIITQRTWLDKDYVEEIFKVMMDGIGNNSLTVASAELSDFAPPPMNTMLEKHLAHKEMVTNEAPPTNKPEILEPLTTNTRKKPKQQPRFPVCNNLKKGHKFTLDCPRNNQIDKKKQMHILLGG